MCTVDRYNPVPRQHLDNEVFAAFYESHPQPPTPTAASGAAGAHRLALMLMVLAIGSLMDPSLPAYGIEAEKYHRLARAALFRSALEDEPTLHAVQALVSSSHFLVIRTVDMCAAAIYVYRIVLSSLS